MMRTISFFLVGFFACLGMSCSKDDNNEIPVEIDYEYMIGSHWVNPVIEDTLWHFDRASKLYENCYGISFLQDNQIVERKNAGWCGTPPVYYADFDGQWNLQGDTLSISVGYWGGTAQYKWKIIAVTNQHLTVYKISEIYPNPIIDFAQAGVHH